MEFKALDNERWVWAKTFKGDYPNYLVSDMGRCYNYKTKRFVGHFDDEYWMIHLRNKDISETIMIGRLMLISFNIEIPEHIKYLPLKEIDAMHLDGDSTNNNLSNFAWGNAEENANEANRLKRISYATKGEKNAMYGKHKPEDIRLKISKSKRKTNTNIIQLSKEGETIREWYILNDIERELGISRSNVRRCCNGQRSSAGGYIWKYKEEEA